MTENFKEDSSYARELSDILLYLFIKYVVYNI